MNNRYVYVGLDDFERDLVSILDSKNKNYKSNLLKNLEEQVFDLGLEYNSRCSENDKERFIWLICPAGWTMQNRMLTFLFSVNMQGILVAVEYKYYWKD